jgi:hypothetical protein
MTFRLTAARAAAILLTAGASPALACHRGAECLESVRVPPVPATLLETEMVVPPRVVYRDGPPIVARIYQPVIVQPAGYSWASAYGPYGEQRYAVPVPPEVKYVQRDAIVGQGPPVAVVERPLFRTAARPVLLGPGMTRRIDASRSSRHLRARHGVVVWQRVGYGW